MELTKEHLEKRKVELIQRINEIDHMVAEGQKTALMCRGALEQVELDLGNLAIEDPKAPETEPPPKPRLRRPAIRRARKKARRR